MNAVRARAAELRPDLDIPWSDPALMVPIFKVASPLLVHPHIIFENGLASERRWQDHVESDAATMVNLSHAEEVDAIIMAPITQRSLALRQMQYETLMVAKDSLRKLPYGLGYIVRHGGTIAVERVFEHPNQTPEEKEARKQRNLHNMEDVGVTVLEASGNVGVLIEGGTGTREKLPDGTYKKIKRKPDEQLPAQEGFARMVNATTAETRDKLRIMTVVSRYSPRFFRLGRPTTVILDPVKPVEGSIEEVRQQGEDLMARGFELAIELDNLR